VNVSSTIVNLPTKLRKSSTGNKSNNRPLTALQVKNHKEGILADVPPHQGLRLRANKNGSKTWFYRYKLDDKLKQIKIGIYDEGSADHMGLVDARIALTEQRKLRNEGEDPRIVAIRKQQVKRQERREQEKAEYTFATMIAQYCTEKVDKDRKAKGAKEVRRLFEVDLGALADMPVKDVELTDLHEFILVIANRAPDVARRFRAELARAWRYAANTGRTKIPCLLNTDTGGKLTQGKRTRSLSGDELKFLIPWLPNYSRAVEDILMLTLYLGLRSGEVCKLRDEWLAEEKDGWWITIPANEMKRSHSDHRVPLSGTVLKIVNRRKGGGVWFPSRAGGPVKQKILGVEVYAHSGASMAKAYAHKKVCPVKNWAPNDLRKTARSHLAKLGCPFEVAEGVLHHKIPGVAGLYNRHGYESEKRDWLAKLGAHFDELGGV
jgi:integrase